MLLRANPFHDKISLMAQPLTKRTDEVGKVRIFHLTHLDNLPSILEVKGLFSLHKLQEYGIVPHSIALARLQERREKLEVPVAYGDLHDYVPWCFAARPPLLYTTFRGGTSGARQEDIMHLVTTVAMVETMGLQAVFCDGHPLIEFSEFHADLKELPSFLDWDVLQDAWWNNSPDDPDRKRRRQAEFLIRDFAPWSLVKFIGVKTADAAAKVEALLPFGADIKVRVLPEWYY